MSRDQAKPSSHWAKISSQDRFKIRASEPLSRDSSHWAMIRPSQALSPQAKIYFKLQFEPPSLWAEIRAKPSWAVFFSYYFVNKLKGFIKLHLEFEGEC